MNRITTPVKARRPKLIDHWYNYNFRRLKNENPELTKKQIDALIQKLWKTKFGNYVPLIRNFNTV